MKFREFICPKTNIDIGFASVVLAITINPILGINVANFSSGINLLI